MSRSSLPRDPSAPAVWLPGQNLDPAVASGDRVPQWVQAYVPTPA